MIQRFMSDEINKFLADNEPMDVAVGVASESKVLFTYGDLETVYEMASLTKLFTALTILTALHDGIAALEDPVGPNGALLSHLLSHSSGISFDNPDLILARPGQKRIYSNAGMDLAASYLESKLGYKLSDFMAEKLFLPLSMTSVTLKGSYAKGGFSNLYDILRLGIELLGKKILPISVHNRISQVAYPNLDGVLPGFGRQTPCDFSFGAEVKDSKHPHWTGSGNSPATFGHFGKSGSFIWVDAEHKLTCVYLGKRPFENFHKLIWPQLSDMVLSVYSKQA